MGFVRHRYAASSGVAPAASIVPEGFDPSTGLTQVPGPSENAGRILSVKPRRSANSAAFLLKTRAPARARSSATRWLIDVKRRASRWACGSAV